VQASSRMYENSPGIRKPYFLTCMVGLGILTKIEHRLFLKGLITYRKNCP
jgi:hypothetical protein